MPRFSRISPKGWRAFGMPQVYFRIYTNFPLNNRAPEFSANRPSSNTRYPHRSWSWNVAWEMIASLRKIIWHVDNVVRREWEIFELAYSILGEIRINIWQLTSFAVNLNFSRHHYIREAQKINITIRIWQKVYSLVSKIYTRIFAPIQTKEPALPRMMFFFISYEIFVFTWIYVMHG